LNTNETFLVASGVLFMSGLVGAGLSQAKLKPWHCIIATELVLLSIYAAIFHNLGSSVLLVAHLLGFLPLLAAMFVGYYFRGALRRQRGPESK
jgi:nicotinamide riboside transporter PnuC